METNKMKSSVLLLLTALIWGVAFVAQSVGMDYVGPFTFNAVRCLLGGLVLLPFLFFSERKAGKQKEKTENGKILLHGGVLCGIALFAGSSLQQIGIISTTVGKAGFITALYIIIVPILGIFLKKKVQLSVWIAVLLALCGFYLLCVTESFAIQKGDAIVLAGAVAFSFHILIIDHFSVKVSGVKMACIQFFVCAFLCSIGMLLFEKPSFQAVLSAWLPIGYAGILSCGIGYTFQIIGQKGMNPSVASLILSLESVFSVLAGWILLNQKLKPKEIAGCVLVFAAIILAQLPKRASVLKKAQKEKSITEG